MTDLVPPGTVLRLHRDDWRYGNHELLLRVDRVRAELSGYYDGEWVWIDGQQLGGDGTPLGPLQALVRTDAIPRSIVRPGRGPG